MRALSVLSSVIYCCTLGTLGVSALSPGTFKITNYGQQLVVSRSPIEDFSLNPKPIVSLPSDVDGNTWLVVERDDYAGYALLNGGAKTAVIHGSVYAVLTDVPPPVSWNISVEDYTTGLCSISTEAGFWTLSNNKPYEQVTLGTHDDWSDNMLWRFDPAE